MIIAGICLLLIIARYLFRPQQIVQFSNASSVDITVTINRAESGQAIQHVENYQLGPQDDAFDDLQQTLRNYAYHANMATLLGKDTIDGNCYTLLIASEDEWLVITDKGLLINNKAYSAGYWGYSVEEELVSELLSLLSLNVPVN